MRTVHKYVLTQVENEIETHAGARFLHVANQREQICVWAEVNTDLSRVTATLFVVGTGNPVPARAKTHLGSAVMADGDFIFHVYQGGGW